MKDMVLGDKVSRCLMHSPFCEARIDSILPLQLQEPRSVSNVCNGKSVSCKARHRWFCRGVLRIGSP